MLKICVHNILRNLPITAPPKNKTSEHRPYSNEEDLTNGVK